MILYLIIKMLDPTVHNTAQQNTAVSWSFPLSNSNGKEKDYESGFHYYGARYYWSELLTGWLSVDPMSDKYPGISPYAYCMWNPVKLVDPDGREAIDEDDWYKNKETGAVFWREGHAKQIKLDGDTYENIGASYSHPLDEDAGLYKNYYQNCIINVGEKRDASKLAYEDMSIRTRLIKRASPLPECHKTELFAGHVRSRGVNTYLSTSGGVELGIDVTFCAIIGINVHGGVFVDNERGVGMYGGVNYCTGMEAGLSVSMTRVPAGQSFSGENQVIGGGFIISGSYNIKSNSSSASFSPSKLGFDAGVSTKIGWTWSTPAIRLF